ncbi:protein kinase domain-containing protein [Microscilla marina]|uniref:Protein kinase domain protein n=1 Tax=Microscilla marina ATCC 23134 TaxID=313606 RepID=A1ZRC2_MICM2|nr:protein kinase [Microscilla marina]EAY27012.1 protein kinase domain protein [Microscilla marina ATCC 23134]
MHNLSIPNYVLLGKTGEGGFGVIYKAKHINTGQLVAIKLQKKRPLLHTQHHLTYETQLCAQIDHPHIVKLLDQGCTPDKKPFAVFEYVAGETLKERILKNNRLTITETYHLMGQLLDALVCIHSLHIVHRDLKPQNIMVSHTGAVPHIKLLDFGAATFTLQPTGIDTKTMAGTPAYSAPEQLQGTPPTVKLDLYAWGLIFLECLKGAPIVKGNATEAMRQQLSPQAVSLPKILHHHPLGNLLRWTLKKKAGARIGKTIQLYRAYTLIDVNTLPAQVSFEPTHGQPQNTQITQQNSL